ncbi:hypothetical protein [Rahnella inusitata]|uniref:hypothetical protein n=1 Tax=Rahnella inusitata TaxID=58169 RepID=UPI0039AF8DDE
MSRIIILHEYGEKTHYSGVIEYAKRNNIKISFLEFDFIRTFASSIRDRNGWLLYKLFRDFILLSIFFIFPIVLRKHMCIVGIAPYDWRVFLLIGSSVEQDIFIIHLGHIGMARNIPKS